MVTAPVIALTSSKCTEVHQQGARQGLTSSGWAAGATGLPLSTLRPSAGPLQPLVRPRIRLAGVDAQLESETEVPCRSHKRCGEAIELSNYSISDAEVDGEVEDRALYPGKSHETLDLSRVLGKELLGIGDLAGEIRGVADRNVHPRRFVGPAWEARRSALMNRAGRQRWIS
jgi:hypothetical protein